MMKMKKLGLMILVCSLLFVFGGIPSTSANGPTTKWVDQASGSDTNDGNTEPTAYKTLQFAIDNSTSGLPGNPSIIYVKGGIYGTSGQTTQCEYGFPAAIFIKDLDYLTIQAVPGHEPVVRPGVAADIVSITIQNSDYLIIDNIDSDQTIAQFDNWHVCDSDDLTVRNSTFEGGEDGIDFNTDLTTALIENNTFKDVNTGSGDEVLDFTDGSYSDIVIQDNVFENNYRHITINPPSGDTATNFTIRRNIMDGTNNQEAVRLIGADGVTLENNVIMNSTQQGLYIDSGSSNINVWHNSFFYNGFEELRTKVNSSDIVIKNNIFYANGTYAALAASTSPLPGEDYNLIFNEGSSTESGSQPAVTSFGANTITGSNPLFVSTTGGSEDLHLQPGSPAIEAGTDLGVTDDIEKNIRPNPAGTDPDLGAYEVGRPIEVVDIDIKPGSDPNSINPTSKGKIPVAILSTSDFDAPNEVDWDSLTFGHTGEEESLAFCSPSPEDVNNDDLDDLICHFDTQSAGFGCGDEWGYLKGQTAGGVPIEGSDSVKIVPCEE